MQVENEHAEVFFVKQQCDDYLANKENAWIQHEHYYCIGKKDIFLFFQSTDCGF